MNVIQTFLSFDAFCEASLTVPVSPDNADMYERKRSGLGQKASWSGSTLPLDQVVREIRNGWPEGVEEALRIFGRITVPIVRSVRRKQVWGAQGDSVDMQRIYRGDIERAFRGSAKAPVGIAKNVRFVVNWASPQNVSRAELFYRGGAVSVLTDALVGAGYSTSIYLVKRTDKFTQNGDSYKVAVRVKGYEEPFTLSTLVAMVGHAATYRRIGHACMINSAPSAVNSWLGSPQTGATLADFADILPHDPTARTVYVPADITTERAAVAFVEQTIAFLENGVPC